MQAGTPRLAGRRATRTHKSAACFADSRSAQMKVLRQSIRLETTESTLRTRLARTRDIHMSQMRRLVVIRASHDDRFTRTIVTPRLHHAIGVSFVRNADSVCNLA